MDFYTYAETLPPTIKMPVIAGIKLPFTEVHTPDKPMTARTVSAITKQSEKVYTFPPAIEEFLRPALPGIMEKFRKNYYNSRMLRFSHYDGDIHLETVYYFHHRLIHHSMDEEIYPDQTIREAFIDELIYETKNPRKNSIFPNGLGINMAIITTDNYLIVPKRSKNVSIGKNKYAPSVSFGAIYKHVNNIIEWNIRNALMREYNYIPQSNTTIQYLGTYKNLYTMGSPEMYFLMKIPEGIEEFEVKISEENRKIGAIEADKITENAEAIAYYLDPSDTSEHLFMLLYLIDKNKKILR